VFTQTGSRWSQVTELTGSDTVADDYFGQSVAMSGTTVVVGAQGHADGGRVYVFTEKAGKWPQTVELEDPTALAVGFGYCVAISGATIVAGDPGPNSPGASWVDVFSKTASGWPGVPAAELRGSGAAASVNFGQEVAVSGTTAVVADPLAGRAYLFEV
jgi:hypothetical protein